MVDLLIPPNDKDYRVVGLNPCLPLWAPVLTPCGIKKLKDITVGDLVWSGNEWASVANKWSTGVKKVYEYETNAGTFYGTENHKILQRGTKVEVGKATSIDICEGPDVDIEYFDSQAIMDGLVLGDGTYHEASDRVLLCIGDRDDDYFTDEHIEQFIYEKYSSGEYDWIVQTTLTPDEVVRTFDRQIPDKYFYSNAETTASFLRGLYSANGSIVRGRITLKSSSKRLIKQTQMMLSSLGIRSYYTTNKKNIVVFNNGPYECKESYDLNITVDRDKFYHNIGFIQEYKTHKLESIIGTDTKSRKNTYEIKNRNFVSEEEVYDITLSSQHVFWTGGLLVSNCGEQTLESYECCTLVEVHLNRADDLDDFRRTLKFAYMYAKTVTLVPTHWPQTNAIMQRNRRLGVSLTGIAQFYDEWGVVESKEWLNEGYNTVKYYDQIYSEWLCIRESIKVTTVKPSGSVSLLSGATPGVHWPVGSGYYMRAIRMSNTDPILEALRKANYKVELDIRDKEHTSVAYFPVEARSVRNHEEVSLFEKLGLAVMAQKYWSDNGVSVTLSFHREEEKDLIAPALRLFEGNLKAVSFLPIDNNSYPQMPYTSITKEEYETYSARLKKVDWSNIYDGKAGENLPEEGDKYCTNDSCEVVYK